MPNKIVNRVKMTVTGTPGTGTITLGSAVAGFQSMAGAGVVNADTVPYVIEDGSAWELGVGTITVSGSTYAMSRSVTASSTGGSAIVASSSSLVFITPLAADLQAGTSANNLVSLDGSAKLPAVDGSAVTNLNMGAAASGTLAVARGGTGLTSLGTGVTTALGNAVNGASGICVRDASNNLTIGGSITANTGLTVAGGNAYMNGYNWTATDGSGYFSSGSGTYTCGWYGSSGAMIFRAGGTTTRMTLDAAGNLGLGVSSPASRLHVSSANGEVRLDSTTALSTNSGMTLTWRSITNAGGTTVATATILGARENATSDNYSGYLAFSTTTSGGSLGERARIDSSGNLLVGTTSGSYKLYVKGGNTNSMAVDNGGQQYTGIDLLNNGTVKSSIYWDNTNARFYISPGGGGVYLASAATSWTSVSDERLKDIIEPISNGLSKVSQLRCVIGKFKTDAVGIRRSFLIAQDVQKVFPEAVDASNQSSLGVQYTDVIPLLVAAIKELAAEVATLKGQLNG